MVPQSTHTALILIVEDDVSTAEVLALAISQETSYQSLHVTTGQEALQTLTQIHPDLIILDYRLPDTTGIELYDQFQTYDHLKSIPTLLMSATKSIHKIEQRNIPMMDKPFDLDEFLMTIEKLISSSTPSHQR